MNDLITVSGDNSRDAAYIYIFNTTLRQYLEKRSKLDQILIMPIRHNKKSMNTIL